MDKYKELNMRVTLMHNKAWVETISALRTLDCDSKNKDYVVVYKEEKQRKDREFYFHKVEYINETNSFIFTRFAKNFEGNLTDEVASTQVLMDIEIISLKIKDKPDWSAYLNIR